MKGRLGLAAGLLGAVGLGAAALLWPEREPEPEPEPPARPGGFVTLATDAERTAPPPGAPNLVLVIGCTVRKDQTSLYGGPPGATPFLASLAAQGAKLDDLITAAPWTRAASTAILTGQHPVSIGMAEPGAGRDERVLADRVVTLAEHLRASGYATVGLTTNPNLNAVYGFDQGFDAYRQPAHLWREVGIKTPGSRAVPEALALLDALPGDRPFYLQLMLIDAHAPHVTSDREVAAFTEPGLPEEVARYRASLARLDEMVALLDAGLRERGFGPNDTVLAFANDHGEGLNWPVHHGGSHGRYLAPSSVGGVFVVRGPGVAPGVVVPGVASQIDLAPTLVGLLGLPPMPTPGQDLSDALAGHPSQPRPGRAFTETWFKDVNRAAVYTDQTACQLDLHPQGEIKGHRFVDGCFDRRSDPLHEQPHRDDALEEELRGWRRARISEAEAFGPVENTRPDADTRQQLEALGYTE